jgi:hypothetical protein
MPAPSTVPLRNGKKPCVGVGLTPPQAVATYSDKYE